VSINLTLNVRGDVGEWLLSLYSRLKFYFDVLSYKSENVQLEIVNKVTEILTTEGKCRVECKFEGQVYLSCGDTYLVLRTYTAEEKPCESIPSRLFEIKVDTEESLTIIMYSKADMPEIAVEEYGKLKLSEIHLTISREVAGGPPELNFDFAIEKTVGGVTTYAELAIIPQSSTAVKVIALVPLTQAMYTQELKIVSDILMKLYGTRSNIEYAWSKVSNAVDVLSLIATAYLLY
jgi:hypothetical protein